MLTFEKVPQRHSPAVYLAKCEDKVVGMLEKYKNTRTDTHPWKAYKGSGAERVYLGVFYGKTGYKDAVKAIMTALMI
jgi:hypothetical protein